MAGPWGSPSSGLHINRLLAAVLYFFGNVAGRGGPDQGLGIGVVSGGVDLNRRNQLGHILKDAAPESALCQIAEKALHQVEPRAAGGGEVNLEAGMTSGPCFERGMLVGRIVITDQVDLFAGRRAPV